MTKKIPGVIPFLCTDIYKSLRFRFVLAFSSRKNYTFTAFMRVPSQYDALINPVYKFLRLDQRTDELKIMVVGCSNGSEPYSIASVLKKWHPQLAFTIKAIDNETEMIERAREGIYTADEVYSTKTIPDWFVQQTFNIENNLYRVKKEIKNNILFELSDALDPNLKEVHGVSDIVFAQNFLYHVKPRIAKRIFKNICLLLKNRAVLFIDGMDVSLRTKLTRSSKLQPLKYKIKEIHDEARVLRGSQWPWIYWGLEPFSTLHRDYQRKYSTVFLKNKSL